MAYRIDLFDATGARVAILQEEILTSLDLDIATNAAPQLTLSIPVDDPKSAYISPLYHLKIWNSETSAYEFSVFRLYDPEIDDSGGVLEIKATYQGILTRLSEEHVDAYDTTSAGDTFTNVVTALLAFQVNTPAITVGSLEMSPDVAIAVESSDIYSALNSLRSAYGGWFEVDADYHLNWYADTTGTPQRRIERRKNLKAITYTPQYSEVVNRVYAYGKGEGAARVCLTDAGEAQEYIDDAASQTLYGVRARKYIDKSITHPTTLLNYAQRILAQYKDPPYQYTVDVLNLAELNGYDYSFESLSLDTRVRVIDDLLGVDVNTSIVSMSINLLSPDEISIGLSTIKTDLSDLFGEILSIQDMQTSIATQIGAGQVTVLGTFVVQDWVTDGSTTIDGGNITANTITVDQLQAGIAGDKTYRQATAPLYPSEGDIWFDTDDGNLMYRYDGAAWVETQDAAIGDAISDAATAQATADGKVTTFYQDGQPTADGVGDLWVDTDDGNKLYRWSGSAWIEIQDADIAQAIADAATAQSTADGKIVSFYQDTAPTADGVGDIWFDTDAGNKQYRWSGTAWVEAALTPAQTIATINLDGGTVRINGDQIQINGDTTFASGYDPSDKIATGGAASDVNSGTTTISGGKIATNSIEANTLKTSVMTSRTITLSGTDSIIKGNYSAGTSGWQIKGNGDAEFNDVTIRGTLAACTVGTGQTLSVVGTLQLSGSADLKIVGSSASFKIYESSSDSYPALQSYASGGGTIRLRSDGSTADSEISIDSSSGITLRDTSFANKILLSTSSNLITLGTTTTPAISLAGGTGKVTCKELSCSDACVLPVGTNKY